jgi:hypothetical protein
MAACTPASEPASPAQLGALQSPDSQVRGTLPDSTSLSRGALTHVTTLGKSRMR